MSSPYLLPSLLSFSNQNTMYTGAWTDHSFFNVYHANASQIVNMYTEFYLINSGIPLDNAICIEECAKSRIDCKSQKT